MLCSTFKKVTKSSNFELLTAVSVKMAVFWDVTSYSVVASTDTQEDLLPQTSKWKTEAAGSAETLVSFYQMT
jgi:hypothetical protein